MIIRTLVICLLGIAALSAKAQEFRKHKIELLGRWQLDSVPESYYSRTHMGVYGFAFNNREYAVVSANDGTYIIDVTQPATPVQVSVIRGRLKDAGWREYRTYKNYLYMVSDGSRKGTFQIADLSYLPDSVHLVLEDSTWVSSHTITIDGEKLYRNIVTDETQWGGFTVRSMGVYSLANPEKPVFLRYLDDDIPSGQLDKVHDSYVRNDTVFASAGYDGYWMFKLDGDSVFRFLGNFSGYQYSGYNHSSCPTADSRYMVVTDEVPQSLPAKIFDVSNPTDIKLVSTFSTGSMATPHNLYLCRNNFVAVAYYEDGLQIFDVTDPYKPTLAGYFDTHYQSDSIYQTWGRYAGAWGAYTELPSGRLLVLDRTGFLY